MNTEVENTYTSLFEDDYLLRTVGSSVASKPDVALTELVANAWDAGATEVNIFIPDHVNDILYVEDNGVGMSKEDFQNRWMKLGYNRLKHQGKMATFPDGVQGTRYAYGRNGVGRHGLLCFGDEYTIITSQNGEKNTYVVTTKETSEPLSVRESKQEVSNSHGTRLEVNVERNLPNVSTIRDILSARFLHDPAFVVYVNRVALQLEEFKGLLFTHNLEIYIDNDESLKATMYFVDTQKTGRKSIYQGVAFWQCGRLVGDPSWLLGSNLYLDGRTTFAKRYSVIVSSNDLSEYIKEDWTGFKQCPEMALVYEKVAEYLDNDFANLAQENIEETKSSIKEQFCQELRMVSPLTLYEIDEAITNMAITNPKAKQESLKLAVGAIINLEKSRSGQELLAKLSTLDESDIEGLNQILSKWSVKDALTVLNEIDRRLTIIEAISKLESDASVDELHVLHPMMTKARWLFGAEYDSTEYTSNRQLGTVIKEVFGKTSIKRDGINYSNRPDIVCFTDSTLSVTGLEEYNSENDLFELRKILVIELKRGGFVLGLDEKYQGEKYINAILASSVIPNVYVNAYVVGHTIDKTLQRESKFDRGRLTVTTYSQLIDTAKRRLFGLRDKLCDMYDDVPGMELYKQAKLF